MTAFKCDICGKFYEPYGGAYIGNRGQSEPNTLSVYNVSVVDIENARHLERIDTCPECMEAFKKFLDGRRRTPDKAENKGDDSR